MQKLSMDITHLNGSAIICTQVKEPQTHVPVLQLCFNPADDTQD